MADDTGADDKMTVRERRAQHAKEQARKDAPGRFARKAALPALVILILAGVAAGFWYTSSKTSDCPTHWHATFGVFVPSEGNASQPQQVSFRSSYFDISSGRTPERAHMHQSDGINQMHFEQAGTCVGVEEWLGYVDVDLEPGRLELRGHHDDLGQAGTWRDEGDQKVHVWVEEKDGDLFTWRERSVRSVDDYQLKDGEKLLVYYGSYTDAQVEQMKSAVPDPVSRTGGPVT